MFYFFLAERGDGDRTRDTGSKEVLPYGGEGAQHRYGGVPGDKSKFVM
jgi:hypothetical protein